MQEVRVQDVLSNALLARVVEQVTAAYHGQLVLVWGNERGDSQHWSVSTMFHCSRLGSDTLFRICSVGHGSFAREYPQLRHCAHR